MLAGRWNWEWSWDKTQALQCKMLLSQMAAPEILLGAHPLGEADLCRIVVQKKRITYGYGSYSSRKEQG